MSKTPYDIEAPDRTKVFDTLVKILGEEKAAYYWGLICRKLSINPHSAQLLEEEIEQILLAMINEGGLMAVCGRSLHLRLKTYQEIFGANNMRSDGK